MGGRGAKLESGGFSRQDYESVGTIDGIKVLRKKSGGGGLPQHSNTPGTTYIGLDSQGNPNQIRVFTGRNAYSDIEWNHDFREGGKSYPKGTVHIQHWRNGERESTHNLLSPAERKQWEATIKKATKGKINLKWE